MLILRARSLKPLSSVSLHPRWTTMHEKFFQVRKICGWWWLIFLLRAKIVEKMFGQSWVVGSFRIETGLWKVSPRGQMV